MTRRKSIIGQILALDFPMHKYTMMAGQCSAKRLLAVLSVIWLLLGTAWGRGAQHGFRPDARSLDEMLRDTTPAGLARWRAEVQARNSARQGAFSDSQGLRCIGRWPFGNSYGIRPSDHFDRDSLIFLESGSGIQFAAHG